MYAAKSRAQNTLSSTCKAFFQLQIDLFDLFYVTQFTELLASQDTCLDFKHHNQFDRGAALQRSFCSKDVEPPCLRTDAKSYGYEPTCFLQRMQLELPVDCSLPEKNSKPTTDLDRKKSDCCSWLLKLWAGLGLLLNDLDLPCPAQAESSGPLQGCPPVARCIHDLF